MGYLREASMSVRVDQIKRVGRTKNGCARIVLFEGRDVYLTVEPYNVIHRRLLDTPQHMEEALRGLDELSK